MANEQRTPPPRGNQPPAARPPARTPDRVDAALPAVMRNLPAVAGMHRQVATLHDEIRKLAGKVHLLSPTIDPSYVPEFHEVSIRLVAVDDRLEHQQGTGDVYKAAGWKDDERALTRVALDRIAAAAGISWDPVRSGRVDDGSDPYYVRFRAVGVVPQLDGSRRVVTGEKEIDLRDGHPAIFTQDESRMGHKWDDQKRRYTDEVVNRGFVKGWSENRLAEARQHILTMAESKAKNRVVRSLGVRHKYRVSDLQKPFAVLALVLTGASTDPELERMAKSRMLDAAINASQDLYGQRVPLAPSRAAQAQLPPPVGEERQPPPPLDQAREPGDEDPDDDDNGAIREGEIVCGCPDGPAGRHEPGCPEGGAQ